MSTRCNLGKGRAQAPTRPAARRGVVLIVVLVVIVLLALAAYGFTELMLAEQEAAGAAAPASQAMALADSGVALVQCALAEDAATRESAGGLANNASRFSGREVCDDGEGGSGRFSVISPALSTSGTHDGVRYGVEDESARLNLLTVLAEEQGQPGSGRTRLMALPGMTEQIADALLDWLDADDEIREFGAEREYYSALDPPYAPTNGPPASLDELLLVQGITPEIWFGLDSNRSGQVEEAEQLAWTGGADNSRGEMQLGWSALVTMYGKEPAPPTDENAPIDLNGQDLKQLHTDLTTAFSQDWADFIIAYRQNGPYSGEETFRGPASGQLDLSQQGGTQLASVLDLVGARVRLTFDGQEMESLIVSPFPESGAALKEALPKLLSRTSTSNTAPTGRININQAPAAVLRSLSDLTDDQIQAIISRREFEPVGDQSTYRYPTWILTEGLIKLDAMKKLLPRVCCGGAVYRAQVVGYFDRGGPFARVEAIFDASSGAPRLLFWRELTHLGRVAPTQP